ncbi:MAG TPA: hypothetical protein VHY35_03200 [Stellaceae bacterium]|jgi:hypothetical protein|nr:hypothetical protein [Stellaceae bacterium]
MMNSQYTVRKASKMLGLNLHAWEILMVFSLVAVAVAAVFVVALTRKEASEIKREYDTYKLTVDAKVAEAKVAGIKAGETAGDALARAASLEKEAARLTKEAEEAKLQTEHLKSQVAWRHLSSDQRQIIVDNLSGKTLAIHFDYSQNDPEAMQFSEDLLKAIRDAGIVAYTHPLVSPPAPPGVVIFGTEDDPAYQALKSALDRANVQFKLAPRNGPVRLSIGSKLAPF